jgi:hypothetical protein
MVSRDFIADREAKARACDEVLKSRTFARSEQLIQFLRYICDLELEGRGHEITEYSIATVALHRPADYSPGEDSSVRTRAHSLRRKLQEYYEAEAPDAELRIELPKGSYRPTFAPRPLAAVPALAPSAEAPSQPAIEFRAKTGPGRKVRPWILGVATLALTIGAFLLFRFTHPDPIDALVREAWGPVLQPGSDVLVMISAPPMLRTIPSQPGVKPIAPSPEIAPESIANWYKSLNLEDRGGPIYLAQTRGYAVFSDSVAAMTVSSLVGVAGGSFHAIAEPTVHPRSIHENGLVVIGAPAYTAYLDRLLKNMPYSFRFDPGVHEDVLAHKSSGRVYAFKRNSQARYTLVYGLITVLPSQPGHPRPERTLIFAGFTGSPGAQAGIDYFRSPAALRDLKKRLQQQGYSTFPPAYQVVVRCGVDMETAINSVYETHEVIDTVPVIE